MSATGEALKPPFTYFGGKTSIADRRLPDDSGTIHAALRIARTYLGEP